MQRSSLDSSAAAATARRRSSTAHQELTALLGVPGGGPPATAGTPRPRGASSSDDPQPPSRRASLVAFDTAAAADAFRSPRADTAAQSRRVSIASSDPPLLSPAEKVGLGVGGPRERRLSRQYSDRQQFVESLRRESQLQHDAAHHAATAARLADAAIQEGARRETRRRNSQLFPDPDPDLVGSDDRPLQHPPSLRALGGASPAPPVATAGSTPPPASADRGGSASNGPLSLDVPQQVGTQLPLPGAVPRQPGPVVPPIALMSRLDGEAPTCSPSPPDLTAEEEVSPHRLPRGPLRRSPPAGRSSGSPGSSREPSQPRLVSAAARALTTAAPKCRGLQVVPHARHKASAASPRTRPPSKAAGSSRPAPRPPSAEAKANPDVSSTLDAGGDATATAIYGAVRGKSGRDADRGELALAPGAFDALTGASAASVAQDEAPAQAMALAAKGITSRLGGGHRAADNDEAPSTASEAVEPKDDVARRALLRASASSAAVLPPNVVSQVTLFRSALDECARHMPEGPASSLATACDAVVREVAAMVLRQAADIAAERANAARWLEATQRRVDAAVVAADEQHRAKVYDEVHRAVVAAAQPTPSPPSTTSKRGDKGRTAPPQDTVVAYPRPPHLAPTRNHAALQQRQERGGHPPAMTTEAGDPPLSPRSTLRRYTLSALFAVLDSMRLGCACDRATLFLRDTETSELVSLCAVGAATLVCPLRIPQEHGVAGAVFTSGVALAVADTDHCPPTIFDRSVDDRTGYVTRSLLCFPVRASQSLGGAAGPVVGVVQLVNKLRPASGGFSERDEVILAHSARLAGQLLAACGGADQCVSTEWLEDAVVAQAATLTLQSAKPPSQRPESTRSRAGASVMTLTEAKAMQARQRARERVLQTQAGSLSVLSSAARLGTAAPASQRADDSGVLSLSLPPMEETEPAALIYRVPVGAPEGGKSSGALSSHLDRRTSAAPGGTSGGGGVTGGGLRDVAMLLAQLERSWKGAREAALRDAAAIRSMQQTVAGLVARCEQLHALGVDSGAVDADDVNPIGEALMPAVTVALSNNPTLAMTSRGLDELLDDDDGSDAGSGRPKSHSTGAAAGLSLDTGRETAAAKPTISTLLEQQAEADAQVHAAKARGRKSLFNVGPFREPEPEPEPPFFRTTDAFNGSGTTPPDRDSAAAAFHLPGVRSVDIGSARSNPSDAGASTPGNDPSLAAPSGSGPEYSPSLVVPDPATPPPAAPAVRAHTASPGAEPPAADETSPFAIGRRRTQRGDPGPAPMVLGLASSALVESGDDEEDAPSAPVVASETASGASDADSDAAEGQQVMGVMASVAEAAVRSQASFRGAAQRRSMMTAPRTRAEIVPGGLGVRAFTSITPAQASAASPEGIALPVPRGAAPSPFAFADAALHDDTSRRGGERGHDLDPPGLAGVAMRAAATAARSASPVGGPRGSASPSGGGLPPHLMRRSTFVAAGYGRQPTAAAGDAGAGSPFGTTSGGNPFVGAIIGGVVITGHAAKAGRSLHSVVGHPERIVRATGQRPHTAAPIPESGLDPSAVRKTRALREGVLKELRSIAARHRQEVDQLVARHTIESSQLYAAILQRSEADAAALRDLASNAAASPLAPGDVAVPDEACNDLPVGPAAVASASVPVKEQVPSGRPTSPWHDKVPHRPGSSRPGSRPSTSPAVRTAAARTLSPSKKGPGPGKAQPDAAAGDKATTKGERPSSMRSSASSSLPPPAFTLASSLQAQRDETAHRQRMARRPVLNDADEARAATDDEPLRWRPSAVRTAVPAGGGNKASGLRTVASRGPPPPTAPAVSAVPVVGRAAAEFPATLLAQDESHRRRLGQFSVRPATSGAGRRGVASAMEDDRARPASSRGRAVVTAGRHDGHTVADHPDVRRVIRELTKEFV